MAVLVTGTSLSSRTHAYLAGRWRLFHEFHLAVGVRIAALAVRRVVVALRPSHRIASLGGTARRTSATHHSKASKTKAQYLALLCRTVRVKNPYGNLPKPATATSTRPNSETTLETETAV